MSPSKLESGETVVTFTDKPIMLNHYEGCVKNVTEVKTRGDAKHFKNILFALQTHAGKVVKELKGKPRGELIEELATNLYENDETLRSLSNAIVGHLDLKRATKALATYTKMTKHSEAGAKPSSATSI
eukprot:gnl/MRDRNA2_/MRDRNA2_54606_c0_seq2.p1 gnl/MRDRNA2_/MRDRNA2_54606_c0~~gnl/MRDRNA2_/MRDRNA2_54606_c0_seq2.p1  ORF type:complete len:128 (-),score=18.88 gnl/MRDRNA2_/MRDRNA2_54606_c0_seq2:171-554(-)